MKTQIKIYLKFTLILIIIFQLSSCKVVSPTNFENSGNKIDLDYTKMLYDNYNKNLKPVIENRQMELVERTDYNATEYIFISQKQLRDYLDFLEYVESQNKDKANHKISGIAIFLGAHSKTKTMQSIPGLSYKNGEMTKTKNKRGGDMRHRITAFIAPTYRDSKDVNKCGKVYENEFQRHIPFYLKGVDPKNKYSGSYASLYDFLVQNDCGSANRNSLMLIKQTEDTSLNAEEFNAMPPDSQ